MSRKSLLTKPPCYPHLSGSLIIVATFFFSRNKHLNLHPGRQTKIPIRQLLFACSKIKGKQSNITSFIMNIIPSLPRFFFFYLKRLYLECCVRCSEKRKQESFSMKTLQGRDVVLHRTTLESKQESVR